MLKTLGSLMTVDGKESLVRFLGERIIGNIKDELGKDLVRRGHFYIRDRMTTVNYRYIEVPTEEEEIEQLQTADQTDSFVMRLRDIKNSQFQSRVTKIHHDKAYPAEPNFDGYGIIIVTYMSD